MQPASRLAAVAAASLAIATALAAQSDPPPARLLRDLEPADFGSSQPREFTRFGPWTYFAATVGDRDRELYRTAGRPGTTTRVVDLNPGTAGSNPLLLGVLSSQLCFFADDGASGYQLFASDGTAAGTAPVGGPALPTGTQPADGVFADGRLIFQLGRAQSRTLWGTDGTAAGTVDLVAAVPGLQNRTISRLSGAEPDVGGGEVVYFYAGDATSVDLWSTDGTPGNTRRIAALGVPRGVLPTSAKSPRAGVVAVSFVGTGTSLVAYDTQTGNPTSLGANLSLFGLPFAVGGRAFFPVVGQPGVTAIATDGTSATPITLAGSIDSAARFLGDIAGTAWFVSTDGFLASIAPGSNIATSAGTAPIPNGPAVRIGSRFYYTANVPRGLIEADTSTGARTVFPGQASAISVQAGAVMFDGADERVGAEPRRFDPVRDETTLVADINLTGAGGDSRPLGFTAFGERVVFDAELRSTGREPWITDGTTAGTMSLGDLDPGPTGRNHRFATVGDRLWILPAIGSPMTVFTSDGTAAGTLSLATVSSTTPLAPPIEVFAPLGNGIVFDGDLNGADGLHRLDANGTVTTLLVRAGDRPAIVANESHAFVARNGATGTEVWSTDGTPAGTRQVAAGVALGGGGTSLALFDDRLWLATSAGIFVSDVGATTLSRVAGLGGAQLAVGTDRIFAVTDSRIAVADRGATSFTAVQGPGNQVPATATAIGDLVLFTAVARGWVSDGTVAGTRQLDSNDLLVIDREQPFLVSGPDRAFFGALDLPTASFGLYMTDGTPAGTRRVDDIRVEATLPTGGFASPAAVVAAGKLFFQAIDFSSGREPFVVDLGAVAEPVGRTCDASATSTAAITIDASPVLGTTVRIVGDSDGATSAALVTGTPAVTPFVLPGGPGCILTVDPSSAAIVGPITTNAGRFAVSLTIPDLPVLAGAALTMQPLFADTAGNVGVGGGLRLQLGR